MIIDGDCLQEMPKLPSNSVDMILTDLPYYGVVTDDWDNQWKSEEEYVLWLEQVIFEYDRVLKEGGNLFLFSSRQYNRKLNTILDSYFEEKRIIIWSRKRNRNTTRGKSLTSGYEPISYYSKGSGVFNNIKVQPQREDLRERYSKIPSLKDGVALSDIWNDIPAIAYNSKEKVAHSTQKPIKLFERIILIGSNEEDVILDSCAGSLTTAVACQNLNRNYICIEANKEYVEIGKRRLHREI